MVSRAQPIAKCRTCASIETLTKPSLFLSNFLSSTQRKHNASISSRLFSFINNRTASALSTKTRMYPKVKVRTDGEDDRHAYNWSSLLSLKDIQFLCLQDSCFPVKGHQDVSPPTIASIPKSYVPNVSMPKVSVSEGTEKINDFTEEDRPNIRASSIPRPRAVLSSPDNDAVIRNNNRTKVARPTASMNNKLIQSRHELCKVVPSQVTDASPTNTRKYKSTPDNNSELKVKKGPPTEVSSQRRKISTDKPRVMGI